MKAVIYEEYGGTPALTDVPEPQCPDGGVVVAVRATGVCRSDWHAWKGHDPVSLPHTPQCGVGLPVPGRVLGDEHTRLVCVDPVDVVENAADPGD